MKNVFFAICVAVNLLNSTSLLSQVKDDNCNRSVEFKEYGSLLPPDFCMPKGFNVFEVYRTDDWRADTVDINNDGISDIIIQHYKKNWKCADTVFFTAYLGQTDTTFQYCKTFSNLCTPLVNDFFNIDWLVKNCEDEYIDRYGWENIKWIRFKKGYILVPFSTGFDYNEGFDFYFEYDNYRHNWYLKKLQKWIMEDYTQLVDEEDGSVRIGTTRYEKKYIGEIETINDDICIDDFKIDDYLAGASL